MLPARAAGRAGTCGSAAAGRGGNGGSAAAVRGGNGGSVVSVTTGARRGNGGARASAGMVDADISAAWAAFLISSVMRRACMPRKPAWMAVAACDETVAGCMDAILGSGRGGRIGSNSLITTAAAEAFCWAVGGTGLDNVEALGGTVGAALLASVTML